MSAQESRGPTDRAGARVAPRGPACYLPPNGDRSLSLAYALDAVARQAGRELNMDDVIAALGLSFLTCAAPDEADLGRWPLHARDSFVLEAASLFGLTLRAVHPPDAASGIHRAPEFAQHFHASYRPLILRALEHGQAVLAWRGWPGDRSGLWGLICEPCSGGIGMRGVTMPLSGDPQENASLALESPPAQLYVVETAAPAEIDPNDLLALALDHARRALGNELAESLGVATGPAAYDLWISRLIGSDAAAPSDLPNGHGRMSAAVVAAQRSAIRFLQRHASGAPTQLHFLIEALIESCRTSVRALSGSTDRSVVAGLCQTPTGRAKLAEQIAAARAAATKALIALQLMNTATKGG